jgi:hypothetical protein
MLCHDAPEPSLGPITKIIRDNPHGWSEEALAYADEGRARLTSVFNQLRPHLLVHAHFHVSARGSYSIPGGHDHTTRIVSLASGGMDGNLAILTIRTLQVELI